MQFLDSIELSRLGKISSHPTFHLIFVCWICCTNIKPTQNILFNNNSHNNRTASNSTQSNSLSQLKMIRQTTAAKQSFTSDMEVLSNSILGDISQVFFDKPNEPLSAFSGIRDPKVCILNFMLMFTLLLIQRNVVQRLFVGDVFIPIYSWNRSCRGFPYAKKTCHGKVERSYFFIKYWLVMILFFQILLHHNSGHGSTNSAKHRSCNKCSCLVCLSDIRPADGKISCSTLGCWSNIVWSMFWLHQNISHFVKYIQYFPIVWIHIYNLLRRSGRYKFSLLSDGSVHEHDYSR